MSGEYVHGDLERQLHHGFVGRDGLLDELARWLLHDGADRCIALLGGPGVGKTAIVTRWAARCQAGRELVFHHVVRRHETEKAEPWLVVRALGAQIEDRFPHLREPFERPEARFAKLLSRVSARELVPHGRRLVLVIDGLEQRPSGSDLREVLAGLPRTLPAGVRLLLAGRLRDLAHDLEGRYGPVTAPVTVIDLDDPRFAADHDATVRAFWQREAPALGLDAGFVDWAVRCAAGNMLHAQTLRKHAAGLPPSQQRPDALPRDLPALLAAMWQRVAGDRAAVRALEIVCAAREPLALDQIGRVAGWSDPGDARAAVSLARGLLVETRRGDRASVYGPFHDMVRGYLIERLGPIAVRGHHRELADRLATWPVPGDAATRRYALRFAVGHCLAAGDCRAAHALAGNLAFLEAKCRELGIDEVELDVRRAAGACLAAGEMTLHGELDRLVRAIARESGAMSRDGGADTAELWRRVRQGQAPSGPAALVIAGAGDAPLDSRTGGSRSRAAVRGATIGAGVAATQPVAIAGAAAAGGVTSASRGIAAPQPVAATGMTSAGGRTMAGPGGPALLRPLIGRGGAVTACAVTPDSRRVVAAYADRSLKLWELETGRLLRTMTGHAAAVTSCAVTPDGRRVVSASADTTLKLWDLATGDVLATFEGHTGAVQSLAIAPDGRRVVSASADTTLKLWDLATGDVLATFEGHTGAVEGCAVTPDGRWVVSASADATLKLWELATGEPIATFQGHADTVASCAVTSDGRHVVSGSVDHTLKVWDVGSGRVTTTLKGHAGPVASCMVAPDRRSVYSGSSDTTLRIWDVDTGHLIAQLEGHAGAVTCCAVTPNGRRLISGSTDHTLKVWALDGSTSTLSGGTRPPAVVTASRPAVAASGASVSIVPRLRKPVPAKQLILFLAANPNETNRRLLEEECAAIDKELRLAPYGHDFEFRSKWALTVDEMARHLLDLDPTIVHFRGQGRRPAGANASRDPAAHDDSGIYLHDEQHEAQLVTGRALKMIVKSSAPSARVVVLNACYSDGHAEQLCQVVDCVVGMTRDHDHAARSFAVAFYRMLGHRRSVGDAVAHAVAMLAAKPLPDECVPRCRTPNWVDAHDISLSPDPPAP